MDAIDGDEEHDKDDRVTTSTSAATTSRGKGHGKKGHRDGIDKYLAAIDVNTVLQQIRDERAKM
eukprot:5067140-Amphidinium_carterae.1